MQCIDALLHFAWGLFLTIRGKLDRDGVEGLIPRSRRRLEGFLEVGSLRQCRKCQGVGIVKLGP
jgi:hypothetical protein